MNPEKYDINFSPNQEQVEQLKKWMITENQLRTGLVHYIDIFQRHIEKNTLAVITHHHEAIGFASWDIFKRSGHLAVVAVSPPYRRSGIGRYLMEAVFYHLLQSNVFVLYLECAPAKSERFWKKMGFQTLPHLPIIRIQILPIYIKHSYLFKSKVFLQRLTYKYMNGTARKKHAGRCSVNQAQGN